MDIDYQLVGQDQNSNEMKMKKEERMNRLRKNRIKEKQND